VKRDGEVKEGKGGQGRVGEGRKGREGERGKGREILAMPMVIIFSVYSCLSY